MKYLRGVFFYFIAYLHFLLYQIRHALESLRHGDGLRFEHITWSLPADVVLFSIYFTQEEYMEGDDLGALDCGHDFHSVCIKQWLMHKNLCPICKNTALVT
ncbi:hypothetical protein GW17_00043424 [Ensete ventricosum]|nr:hypothetical protein GW17_00043424 [Ensete ventricosum]RZR76064.1 hypothetical protein BHM03_00000669 [Ensete ventricosum]